MDTTENYKHGYNREKACRTIARRNIYFIQSAVKSECACAVHFSSCVNVIGVFFSFFYQISVCVCVCVWRGYLWLLLLLFLLLLVLVVCPAHAHFYYLYDLCNRAYRALLCIRMLAISIRLITLHFILLILLTFTLFYFIFDKLC